MYKSMLFYSKLLFLVVFCLLFNSCNNAGDSTSVSPEDISLKSNKPLTTKVPLNSQASNFINSFYQGSANEVGRQVETIDGAKTYLVSEILVGSSRIARGYLVTNRGNGSPVFFADVDRVNHVMITKDIITNKTVTINNINQNEKYLSSNEFDFIDVTITANSSTSEGVELRGRPFWGRDRNVLGYKLSPDGAQCIEIGTQTRYVFWIRVSPKDEAYEEPVDMSNCR